MNLLLDGKVVAIAGGGEGIGRATAIAVGDEGCHLVLGARQRDQLDSLEQTRTRRERERPAYELT
jgi:NADP-dependent 3-hydroxy acid dehydrogenase YdfG